MEGTLRVPFKANKKKVRGDLARLWNEVIRHLHDEGTYAKTELTVSANFLLKSSDDTGVTYSVWYGGDYSRHSKEATLAEVTEVRDVTDLSSVVDTGLDEQIACARLDRVLPGGSNVQAVGIINLVYVLRGLTRRGARLVRGEQVALY